MRMIDFAFNAKMKTEMKVEKKLHFLAAYAPPLFCGRNFF